MSETSATHILGGRGVLQHPLTWIRNMISARSAAAALTFAAGALAWPPRVAAQAPHVASGSAFADSARILPRLTALADSLARSNALSGVILLARDGKPVFEHAYGPADRERRVVNTVGTAFNLSSIGKRFTQVAVAQLVASGRLNLDSTIASVWPDYPNPEVARQVTIRQLLQHRSGIGGDVFGHPESKRSNSDYIAEFVHEPLRFAPGTKEEYSNAGYIVLGEVVARAAHEDYYSYIEHHVFAPAHMTTAGFFARDSLPPFVAKGYTSRGKGNGSLQPADALHPRRGSAAGGSYAAAGDLLELLRATRDGRLGITPDFAQSMIAGGSPGSNGVVAQSLPGGYDLIVLENLDPPAADAIVEPVLSWLGVAPPPGARKIMAGDKPRSLSTADQKLPNTPAGRIAAEYLRAYNTGDSAAMSRFFESSAVSDPARPTAARVATYRTIFDDNGKLTFVSTDDQTPTSLTVAVHGDRGSDLSLTFVVESAEPHRLASLRVERGP